MINLIGLPGCGTTSYYRYLVEQGHKVKYWDGWEFTEWDKTYGGDIHIIALRNHDQIKEKNRKRKRHIVNYININKRLLEWKKRGAVIVYLEDLSKLNDFPKLNTFNEDTKLMCEIKRKEDRKTHELNNYSGKDK